MIGVSSFLPVSVRGIAGTCSIASGTCRGDSSRRSAERIRSVLRAEADRGATVVCVSHDPSVLADADRVVGLVDGALAPADRSVTRGP